MSQKPPVSLRPEVYKFAFLYVAAALSVWIALSLVGRDVWTFYTTSLRASLFSGFLSAGGFLFGMKTFILVRMNDSVYATEAYRERYKEHRAKAEQVKKGSASQDSLFGPLHRLRLVLFFSLIAIFTAAFSQFTVGLIPSKWSVLVCLTMALSAAMQLGRCLYHVNENLKVWLDLQDETKKTV